VTLRSDSSISSCRSLPTIEAIARSLLFWIVSMLGIGRWPRASASSDT
jgi:hypothetical protein